MQGTHESGRGLGMALAALGIVFGDIGTSPMYAVNESLGVPGLAHGPETILGVISLIFWSLALIVSVKYMLFITRADHDGEGGIFAIVSLLRSNNRLTGAGAIGLTTAIALCSAALLFADSLITPALSVMAATEGMKAIFEDIDHWVILASLAILLLLFTIQRFGTASLSRIFSPVMICWFISIGVLGVIQIIEAPQILYAMLPHHALKLLGSLTVPQMLNLLGSILLAVTGAEAIYADMGHFGRNPIQLAWYVGAIYGLMLSYFGQGAWLLNHPDFTAGSITPFFGMIPPMLVLPMVGLATLASIIASQAVISGMFSLVSQAIHLEYLPRLKIEQTSESERGQIYVPKINTLLAIGCMLLVAGFGSSSALASAYGFAVAATMLLTTVAFSMVVYYVWRWTIWKVMAFCFFALPLDILFLAATITKLPSGHYLTLIISLAVVWLLVAWILGNRYLTGLAQRLDMPVSLFSDLVETRSDLHYQPRPAIFLQHLPFAPGMEITPNALLRQVQLTSMLYQPSVIVDFHTIHAPRLAEESRLQIRDCDHGIHLVSVSFGFAEPISIEPVLKHGREQGWWRNSGEIVYYSGREDLRSGVSGGLPAWIRWPFMWLHRHDESLPRTLRLPAIQYVELGMTIDV